MKKLLGLALVPVVLASLPLVGMAEPVNGSDMMGPMQDHEVMSQPVDRTVGRTMSVGTTSQIRSLYAKGQWFLVEKNYPEAISTYKQILSINPNHVRTLNDVSLAYYLQGENSIALEHVNKAISIDPVNAKLYFTKGRILDALKREPEALDTYLTFVVFDPTDSNAITALRRCEELYTRWESKLDEKQQAYFGGLRLLSMERPEEAIPMLKKFHTLEPSNVSTHLFLGIAYQQLDRHNEAISSFQQVTKVQPENPTGYFMLGRSLDIKGERLQAREAWKNFLRFAPHSEEVGSINRQFNIEVNSTVR